MVLCEPLLPLHKAGTWEVGGFLKSSNSRHLQRLEIEPIVWLFGYGGSFKTPFKEFSLKLGTTSSQFSSPLWVSGLGADRKISSTEHKLKAFSLDRTMSPQTASWNSSAERDARLLKQLKDRPVVNCVGNSDGNSEVGRVVSEPSPNGKKLDSRCSSSLLNFANMELHSGGGSKELSSQAAEAEFSGNKALSTAENGIASLEAEGMTSSSCRVAVIGAGAAGLVAARELVREGHEVVVFEQGQEVGGVWQYDPKVEDDPLGIDPNRTRVHSSMYHSLRTNLPREIMGFLDYPFVPKGEEEGRDGRRFPNHREVAKYLEDFLEDYNLRGLVKFGVRVDYVGQQVDRKWVVKFQKAFDFKMKEESHEKDCQHAELETEVFDAVVVCNGHYAEPRLADIPGMESWPGVQVHSHNYRFPHPFQDKVVVVIGNGNSANDITSEIALLANEVHQCARAWSSIKPSTEGKGPQHNLWQHPMVTKASSDGTLEFQDGTSVVADMILYCTGYLFSFPFLDTKGYVSVDDNRVDPLYKHIFPPALAPELSFVGLPWKVVPFPVMELQSRWIARLLSRKSSLPSECEMMSDIRNMYEQLEAINYPKSYTHNCGSCQYEYVDWLAEQSGHEPVETWRKEIYSSASQFRKMNPSTYRDVVEDPHSLEVAMASLEKITVPSKGASTAPAKVI
ncbi:unnamed protein product [Calypogeia fissa]